MSYNGYITRIKNMRKHSNSDRLQVGECFGNFVIVSLDTKEGELGCYFPTDGRLGIEYCQENKLLREKDANGNQTGGYMDVEKRQVTTINLRKEKSDGLFMPLKSLDKFCNIANLKEGDTITTLNGILICEKYVSRGKKRNNNPNLQGKKIKKIEKDSYPFFSEHVDTSQLAYNTQQFREGDLCYITLKIHGTSQRTSNTIKDTKKILPYWLHKVLSFAKIKPKSKKSWDYVTGTRRVVLKDYNGGFYGDNDFRKQWHDYFVDKLHKGISVYYEVVGFTHENNTIMPECNNAKTKDKVFIKTYGDTTRFTYGCGTGQNDIYVYRMTMTNEDGEVIEIPWEIVKIYCDKMGVKYVPQLDKFLFTTVEDLMKRVNIHTEGADPIGKIHIKEGVVVRVEGKEKFTAFKHKSYLFKVLEGIIKSEDIIDMEEAESVN